MTEYLLSNFNIQRLLLIENGLLVLLIWAICNILICFVLQFFFKGYKRHFLLMNVFWNVVNLFLAIFGLYDLQEFNQLNLYETINVHFHMEKILLFNGGLDMGYIFLGLWLIEKSINTQKNNHQLKGYGYSIVLQGAFLLIFDLTFFIILNMHGDALETIIKMTSGVY